MAEIDELKAQLMRLEADVANLRGRLAEVADDVGDAPESGGFLIKDPPAGPPPETVDEVEVDSHVLDGSTPSGGSKRREDKSLEWAAGEIAVLRLFAWSDNTKRVKRIPSKEEESSSSSDGIRFLARVPKDADDPTKGAELQYFKLLADGGETPDTEASATGYKPGESIEHYEESSGASGGPLQLRGFADANDRIAGVAGFSETAASGKVAIGTADALVRSRQSGARPKLQYVQAANMPYWLRNGTADTNYAQSIKLGDSTHGYITISGAWYTL